MKQKEVVERESALFTATSDLTVESSWESVQPERDAAIAILVSGLAIN